MVSHMAGTARALLDDSINSFMDTLASATSSLTDAPTSTSSSHKGKSSSRSDHVSASNDDNKVTKTHTVTTTGWEEKAATSIDDKHQTHTSTTLVPATRTTVSTAIHLKSTPAVTITMSLGDDLKTFTMTHSAGLTQPTSWADRLAMAEASDDEKQAWADEHDGEQKPEDDDNPLWLVTNDDETDDLSNEEIDSANSEIRKATSEAWNPTSLGLLPMTTVTFTNTASTPLATSLLGASRATTIAPKATVTAVVKDTEQCDIMDLDCFLDSMTAAPAKPTSTDSFGHAQYDRVGSNGQQDNGPNLSVGAICGLAGGIFLFFLLGAIVIAWTRRRAHDRKELMPHRHGHDGEHGSWVDQGGIYGASHQQRRSYFHPAHEPQASYTYGNVGNGMAPPVAQAAAGARSPPAGYRVLSSRFSDATGRSEEQEQPYMSQSGHFPVAASIQQQDPFADSNTFGGSSQGHGSHASHARSIPPSYGHGRNITT
ncbi:hypothetical protein IE81DRAFT_250277 [Ceraceosorus guamensis]|uniref:Uncharacterized protein n=1 Tax=Ceraceosorus guamensis TaxID=1522189 RepID=A0A316VRQ8_9BASI|nr:hypothetical protein IE81DRAFT_250277 [Ceraceosorus guamensis]PWN39904.1 hypothetical protein IE81DRAFT_250277 [Ceraceosorus guamensis]